MKPVRLTFLACLICATVNAQQDYTKSLEGITWVKIESKSDITVKTHSKNELLINADHVERRPDRAKGLKLVGESGSDNTDIGFYVVADGNNLIVKNLRKSEGAEIFLPATQKISVKTTWQGDIEITGFTGEIEASAEINGDIVITDVTGPVTADALNGKIEVYFTKVSQDSPISIYTTNGEQDITLPENTPADLTLGTVNGEIYTNFDLTLPVKEGLKTVVAKKVQGSINNGGVDIQLKSTNGTIYLRKK
jgi:hypothetical protein